MIRGKFRTLPNIKMEVKAVPYFGRSLMMTVARCWGSIFNKAKILFGVLAKKIQSTFILDNGSNYKMNDGPNDKNVFLLEKWGGENYGCRTFMQDITNSVPIQPFICNAFWNLSVVIQQVNLSNISYGAFCRNSYWKKNHYLENPLFFMILGGTG